MIKHSPARSSQKKTMKNYTQKTIGSDFTDTDLSVKIASDKNKKEKHSKEQIRRTLYTATQTENKILTTNEKKRLF